MAAASTTAPSGDGSGTTTRPPTPVSIKKECWTCGGDHEDLDCPHRVFVERSVSTGCYSLLREDSGASVKSSGFVRDASTSSGSSPLRTTGGRRQRDPGPPASSFGRLLSSGMLHRAGSVGSVGSYASSISNNNDPLSSAAPSSGSPSSQQSAGGADYAVPGSGGTTGSLRSWGSGPSWGSTRRPRSPSSRLLTRGASLRLTSPGSEAKGHPSSPSQQERQLQHGNETGRPSALASGESGSGSGIISEADVASEEGDVVPGLRSHPTMSAPLARSASSTLPPASAAPLLSLRSAPSHSIRRDGERGEDGGPPPMPCSLSALGVDGTRGNLSSLRGPLPPVPTSLRGTSFSVADTPWLSLLTLRYVVAQVWALHNVKISCTLVAVGVAAEVARHWKVALPLLTLLASLLYLRANAWAALATAEAAHMHDDGGHNQASSSSDDNPAADAPKRRVLSPLKRTQLTTQQILRFALRDQSRTKLLVMALQVLPAALELYGLVVLFVRIHCLSPSSPAAATLPLTVAAYLSAALLLCNAPFAAANAASSATTRPLLRFRLVKLGLQFLVLTFLLGAAEYDAFLRLLPPALIAAGGVLFLTLSQEDMEGSVRSALTLTLQDVCLYTRRRITEDELLQVALARWLLEYWTQPTDFSWEDLLPMLQHVLLTLREEMAEAAALPVLGTLQRRLEDMSIDAAAVPMVKAVRRRLGRIAPSKPFTAYLLYYRCTRHLAAFALALLFAWLLPKLGLLPPNSPSPHGHGGRPPLPWALLPLVLQDVLVLHHYLPQLLLLMQADYTDADGASLLLQGTRLGTVWENLRYAVRTLEGGLHVVRVKQPSDKALGFINAMTLAHARARGQRAQQHAPAAAPAAEEEEGWMFASGWAAMELHRIKASPHGSRLAGAAGDATVIYRSLMAVYGEWLVHAPGLFNTWLHSRMFTSTRADIRHPRSQAPNTSSTSTTMPPVRRGSASRNESLQATQGGGATAAAAAASSISSAGSSLASQGSSSGEGSFSYSCYPADGDGSSRLLAAERGASHGSSTSTMASIGGGRGIPIPVLFTPGTSYAVPSSMGGSDDDHDHHHHHGGGGGGGTGPIWCWGPPLPPSEASRRTARSSRLTRSGRAPR